MSGEKPATNIKHDYIPFPTLSPTKQAELTVYVYMPVYWWQSALQGFVLYYGFGIGINMDPHKNIVQTTHYVIYVCRCVSVWVWVWVDVQ